MVQKKSDTVATVEEKMTPTGEESIGTGSFVATFWEQIEQSRERAEQLRENREAAYMKSVKEVIKFNKQYRNTIAEIYEQTKQTNKEMVNELMHQFKASKEEIRDEAVEFNDRDELKQQLKEVSGQLEKLALTPIRSIFHIIDQLEDNFEKNTEANVAYSRERRKAWLQVRREYVKKARNTHLDLVQRGKNSLKELVKTP